MFLVTEMINKLNLMFQSKALFGVLFILLSFTGIQAQEITFVTVDQAQTRLSEAIVSSESELKDVQTSNDRAVITGLYTKIGASERILALLNNPNTSVESAIISLLETSENSPIDSYQYSDHNFLSKNKDRSRLINSFLIDLLKA